MLCLGQNVSPTTIVRNEIEHKNVVKASTFCAVRLDKTMMKLKVENYINLSDLISWCVFLHTRLVIEQSNVFSMSLVYERNINFY